MVTRPHIGYIGFFVFDYSAMDACYGEQAFDAIYSGLRSSSGVCVFHDGDVFNCENVRTLAQQANVIRPSTPESPLAKLSGPFDFGAYFAAMWTNTNANFKKAHDALISSSVPGYFGFMTLPPGLCDLQEFLSLMQQLALPPGVILKDGSVVGGENRYRIGLDHDES